MIRISRGPEPKKLREARWVRLAAAELAKGQGVSFSDYDVGKEDLWRSQFFKCAFCEMSIISPAGQPVEHFRPKGRAIRESGKEDKGYWWLAWSWNNLLFACVTCNSAFKRDFFPLENDKDALKPLTQPPDKEVPLLIDPSSENPMEHIQFFEVRKGKWRPLPRRGSPKGKKTIEITGIDSGAHRDFYSDYAGSPQVTNLIRGVQQAIAASSPDQPEVVQEQWQRLCDELFYETMRLHALAYWIVDNRFPAEVRDRWGLTLPQPGNFKPSASGKERTNPSHEGLPRKLALRCRALGARPKKAVVRSLLVDLCSHGAKSLTELVSMVELSTKSVQTHLSALVEAGQVSQDATGRYR